MKNEMDELVSILEKFAGSGWDLIDGPSKEWLADKNQSKSVRLKLINVIEKADKDCGSCGCDYDALYKRALVLLGKI